MKASLLSCGAEAWVDGCAAACARRSLSDNLLATKQQDQRTSTLSPMTALRNTARYSKW
jgi:hypothetical protein